MCQFVFSAQLLLLLLACCAVRSAVPTRHDRMTTSGSMHKNPETEYKMNGVIISTTTEERDLGVLVSDDMKEMDEVKKNNLVNILSGIFDWTSPEGDGAMINSEDAQLPYRPQRSMYNQHTGRDKGMCKNFFWKTFSAC